MPVQPKTWSHVLAVVTLLIVATAGYYFEDFKHWFPWLTTLQLRSYNWISHLDARKPRSKFVSGVEIDDHTFFEVMRLPAGGATDRRKLGEIIETLSDFHPAVIVMDINLSKEPADDALRQSDNQALLSSIQKVAGRNIPIVLTCGFNGDKQLPNIFADDELPGWGNLKNPYRTRIGFDHAAKDDQRKVPLVVDELSPEGRLRPYNSMALEAVEAYEGALGIKERTVDRLQRPISKRHFVYTSFLRQQQFLPVSASDVLARNETALRTLGHRIVIVGGNRHTSFPAQDDEWLDDWDVPPFRMRGMYLQANYVEGLLDDRILYAVPKWLAFWIDLVLGALMIVASRRTKTFGRRMSVLGGVFFLPVPLAYVASINLGYTFDFVLPLALLFLHAFADDYLQLKLHVGD